MRMRLFIALSLFTVAIGAGALIALDEPVHRVETVSVERSDLELAIRVSGEVINDRRVTLTALVDGQVVSVKAAVGDRVAEAQVLAAMDNRAADAQLRRAQANLRQVEIRLREEQRRYSRLQKLAGQGAASAEQLEAAKLNWETATAILEVAKADLRLAEVAKEWQQVRAPFAAVVVDKSTESGQWVEAGTKLFSLVALDNREIEANVDAVDSGRVRLGQTVEIRCDAFPDVPWHSTVDWIGPSVEREKDSRLNTFRIRLGLGENPPDLLLGQQVDLEILAARRQGVLTLPYNALREREGGYEVGVIESGRLQYRSVVTGLEGESRVELLSGLTEGARVVSLEVDPPAADSRVEPMESP